MQTQLAQLGDAPEPGAIRALQTGLRELHDGMFGTRPVLTLGGYLTQNEDHHLEIPMASMGYASTDRSWITGFSAVSKLQPTDALALIQRLQADWRGLGAIGAQTQETPRPLPELLDFTRRLTAIAEKPEYAQHLFVHRTLEAYEEAERAARATGP